jgi:hypothetical protein
VIEALIVMVGLSIVLISLCLMIVLQMRNEMRNGIAASLKDCYKGIRQIQDKVEAAVRPKSNTRTMWGDDD